MVRREPPRRGCIPRTPSPSTAGLPELSNGLPPQLWLHAQCALLSLILYCIKTKGLTYWVSRWVSCQTLRLVPDVTSLQNQSAPPRLPENWVSRWVSCQTMRLCARCHKSAGSVSAPPPAHQMCAMRNDREGQCTRRFESVVCVYVRMCVCMCMCMCMCVCVCVCESA